MKRFWKQAAVIPHGSGWSVELDGRPLRTPAREALVVPSETLARAIADEWNGAAEAIDPRAMPLTGLANAAIDRIGPHKQEFAESLARYAEADLTCYRAEGPQPLVAVQATAWDSLLGWARRRYDVDFATTQGIVHVDQPPATIERLTHAVEALDAFHLAGLSPLVTTGGSLVAALAVLEKAVTAQQAWDSVSIDERWQIEQWGADEEAVAVLESRKRDFFAGASFLVLLDA